MGVVTLARMVKLLLTVRRLANTWGEEAGRGEWKDSVGGEKRRRKEGGREGEIKRGEENSREVCVAAGGSSSLHSSSILYLLFLQPFNMLEEIAWGVVPERKG